MKYSFVIRGFIDPRRLDMITFNFNFNSTIQDEVLDFFVKTHYEWIWETFDFTESWFINHDSNSKFHHVSTDGVRMQKFKTPTGDVVNIVFNL